MSLAIVGLFVVMVSGVLQSSVGIARNQQAHSQGRAGSRFAFDILGTELAEAGARIPPQIAFFAADTRNNVTDASVADLGTDTLSVLRSRSGTNTQVLSVTGNVAAGIVTLQFHTSDTSGPAPICPNAAQCVAAFEAEHGGLGDFLLVSNGASFWVVRMTADPTANLGPGGNIRVAYALETSSPAAPLFAVGSVVTGVVVRTFRVMNETLEMKEGFFASPGDFVGLAEGIEDLQLGFILADGSYVDDGIPAQVQNVRGTSVGLVAIDPVDLNLGGDEFFVRPALGDRDEGTDANRRRRTVRQEVIWSRNLGLQDGAAT